MSSKHRPKQMPIQQHHQTRIQMEILSLIQLWIHMEILILIQLRIQRLLLQSSSPFPDRPWHDENCFDEKSVSSKKNSHATCDTYFSCHHLNLSSFLFLNWNHVSWTHSFWKICRTWLKSF